MIRGRRLEQSHVRVELEKTNLHRGRNLRQELVGGLLGGGETRGRHVFGRHRTTRVVGEHDRRRLDRYRHGALRASGGGDQHRERRRERHHRQVSAPTRSTGRHGRGKHRGRERRSGVPPPALLADVPDGEQRDREQGDQDCGVQKAHGLPAGRFFSGILALYVAPLPSNLTVTLWPGCMPAIASFMSDGLATGRPFICVTTSPASMPAQ